LAKQGMRRLDEPYCIMVRHSSGARDAWEQPNARHCNGIRTSDGHWKEGERARTETGRSKDGLSALNDTRWQVFRS
jgi:hypothetical protein